MIKTLKEQIAEDAREDREQNDFNNAENSNPDNEDALKDDLIAELHNTLGDMDNDDDTVKRLEIAVNEFCGNEVGISLNCFSDHFS